jgi:predicted transcriptional regulator
LRWPFYVEGAEPSVEQNRGSVTPVSLLLGTHPALCYTDTYDYDYVFSSRGPINQESPRKARQVNRPLPLIPRRRSHFPYLDTNEWQVAGINRALSSIDRGKGIAHARVSEWIASWETRKERPAPRRV